MKGQAQAADSAAQSKLEDAYKIQQSAKAQVDEANLAKANAVATMNKARGMENDAQSKSSRAEDLVHHAEIVQAAADSTVEKVKEKKEVVDNESTYVKAEIVKAESKQKAATEFQAYASAKFNQAKQLCIASALLFAGSLLLCVLKKLGATRAASKDLTQDVENQVGYQAMGA